VPTAYSPLRRHAVLHPTSDPSEKAFSLRTDGHYSEIRISRLDNADLTDAECEQVEKTITDDIFFDFSEDDLWIVFDRNAVPGVLVAYFLDVDPVAE